jgi:hypothetical protein
MLCPRNGKFEPRRSEMIKINAMIGSAAMTALLLAGASVGFAEPLAAQEKPEQKRERFVIVHSEKEGTALKDGDRLRVITGDDVRVLRDCGDGEKSETVSDADGKKTRVIICRKGDVNSGEHAARMAEVLERIASNENLSPEQRARVTQALERALERVRAN